MPSAMNQDLWVQIEYYVGLRTALGYVVRSQEKTAEKFCPVSGQPERSGTNPSTPGLGLGSHSGGGARSRRPARSETPCIYGNTSHENREAWVRPPSMERRAASGSLRTYAGDERVQKVGQPQSNCEVAEQG